MICWEERNRPDSKGTGACLNEADPDSLPPGGVGPRVSQDVEKRRSLPPKTVNGAKIELHLGGSRRKGQNFCWPMLDFPVAGAYIRHYRGLALSEKNIEKLIE